MNVYCAVLEKRWCMVKRVQGERIGAREESAGHHRRDGVGDRAPDSVFGTTFMTLLF